MLMDVERESAAPRLVVTVPGPDLDLATADALRSRFSALRPSDRDTVVVVDLSAVTFLDCAGLGPLMGARARFGPCLLLRGVRPKVWRLIVLAAVDGLFTLEDDARPADDARSGYGIRSS